MNLSPDVITEEQFKQGVSLSYKRNLFLFVLFEIVWSFGMGFSLPAVTVPAYLTNMDASKALIGFIQSGHNSFVFLQLVSIIYFAGRRRIRSAFLMFFFSSLAMLTAGIMSSVWSGVENKLVSIWMFSFLICIFIVLNCAVLPLWVEIITDNIPKNKRGNMNGLFFAFGGIMGLCLSSAGGYVLRKYDFPENYNICFITSAVFFCISSIVLLGVKDNINPSHQLNNKLKGIKDLLPIFKNLIADPNYRIFIFFYICTSIAACIGLAFIIPYTQNVLKASDSHIAFFTKIFFLSGLSVTIIIGRLADKYGYRLVGIILNTMLLICFTLVIKSQSIYVMMAAYFGICAYLQNTTMLLTNMSVELYENISPSILYAIGALLTLPFVLIFGLVFGVIIDASGSYTTVFAIGAAISLIAAAGFIAIVREPRKGDLLYIKSYY
jgi:MFS family permease